MLDVERTFHQNTTFFPTPGHMKRKMIAKIKDDICNGLDPSAGKGGLIEAVCDRFRHSRVPMSAIEIDPDLRATLRGKNIKVIDTDFLNFAGPDKFDLIIANPPFNNGEKHLLKAIDIMYCGQIVFLLNAETLRNPHTNSRKLLVRKLGELNAEIEYFQEAFMGPCVERKTSVETALVYIKIERDVESDLFAGVNDRVVNDPDPEIERNHEVSTPGLQVRELVLEYNQVVEIGTETVVAYYRNYPKIWKYIGMNREPNGFARDDGTLTGLMQRQINEMLVAMRHDFWRRTLTLPQVQSRMTNEKQKEFEHAITQRCDMDFTENNIRNFILNLVGSYEEMLMEAVEKLFARMTYKHSWDGDNDNEKNIHYFNGWKTNKAFMVGPKVILPIHGGWDHGPFRNYSGDWSMDYSVPEQVRDLDVVMNYFDGMSVKPLTIPEALKWKLDKCQQSTKIVSTYFTMTVYKKGTMHLKFNDKDILRRFNVAACKGRNWLPQDYGVKPFKELAADEQVVAESFEGEKSYTKHLGQPLFAEHSGLVQIEFSGNDEPEPETEEPVKSKLQLALESEAA